MCCLDKTNYICCCGCSLTAGTWIIGALMCLEMIFAFVRGTWAHAIGEGILVFFFALTMIDRENVSYRKALYYVYMVALILYLISALIGIILVAIWPEWMEDWLRDECREDESGYFDDYYDCRETLRLWVRAFVIASILLGIWFNALVLRMLKYGWREQAEREASQADLRQGLNQRQN